MVNENLAKRNQKPQQRHPKAKIKTRKRDNDKEEIK